MSATELSRPSVYTRCPTPSRCGVAITDSRGTITGFEEKPTNPRSNWVFSGLMLAGPGLFDFIPPIVPADIAFDVLPRLLGKLQAYHINDYLLDIGTMQNYQRAQNTWPGMDGLSAPSEQVAPSSPASSGKVL